MSTPQSPGRAHGHEHAEAFCHMLYRTDDGRCEEWIWNSRDGVTPFVITTEGRQATHVEWHPYMTQCGYHRATAAAAKEWDGPPRPPGRYAVSLTPDGALVVGQQLLPESSA